MAEALAPDSDAELARVGEVGQRQAPGFRALAEDHVPRRAVERAPVADPPLERMPDAVVGERLRVDHPQMTEQRDRLHGGIALEDRQQQRLPHLGERIGDGPAALDPALRWRAGVGLEAPGGAFAEAGAGGGEALAVTGAVLHVRSHLLVGDGSARHVGTLVSLTKIPLVPARSGQHPRHRPTETIVPAASASRRATPALRPKPPAKLAVGAGQSGCR